MHTKPRRALLALAFLVLSLASFGARAQEVPIVTGEHWTKSSVEAKKAYLIGIANVIQVELAYFGNNPPSDAQSFVPRMARGLRGQTLDTVREKLDAYYAANAGQQSRPVLEVVWAEIVVPGLK